jgi:DNA-binding CsgD family transcriptional regulator
MALVMASLNTPSAAEREVWHLAAATTLPDEQIAVRLEEAAKAAAERRSYATAMDMFELSGRLSPPGGGRVERMISAAEVSMQAGRTEAGLKILDRLSAETQDQDLLTRAVHIRCRIEMWGGKPVVARDRLLDEGHRLIDRNPIWAAAMICHSSLLTTMLGELRSAQTESETAVELVRELPDGLVMPILVVHALVLASLAADQALLIAGQAFDAIEEPTEAHFWYQRAVDAAFHAGAVGLLPFQLSALALAQWRQGSWAGALSTAGEAVSLAEETGWRTEMPNGLVALGLVEAGMGREADCRAHVDKAIRMALGTGARVVNARADVAFALLDLGAGRFTAAANHLDRVATFSSTNELGDPLLLNWAADAVEAGLRGGRKELADKAYAEVQAEAHRSGRPTALAKEARCRALLTDDPDTADAAIEEALTHHEQADQPFEEARTRLVHGELLRRNRRRARAREALERAADLFEMLGATSFAARAADELRAVGGGSRTPAATKSAARLTPQETRIAIVVASGATNAEAAARLFLSQKTIEYHLSSVYRKLGIRSRSQLVNVVSAWGPERDQVPATGR